MSARADAPEMAADSRALLSGSGFNAEVVFSGHNRRIQVVHYRGQGLAKMVTALRRRALELDFDKVFVKAPELHRPELEHAGMEAEASVEGYFAGQPAIVMSLFLDPRRRRRPFIEEQEQILARIRERRAEPATGPLPTGYEMTRAREDDCEDLAGLYSRVFASYPFPITDASYVAETMESHVVYRLVRDGRGRTVAAASAETCRAHRNAEMTDFATLPDQRGNGLAQHILGALEEDMRELGIPNLYTIARARSAGMNRVFYNAGYEWTGTLVNNCHIAGQLEDMHVWCKRVQLTALAAGSCRRRAARSESPRSGRRPAAGRHR